MASKKDVSHESLQTALRTASLYSHRSVPLIHHGHCVSMASTDCCLKYSRTNRSIRRVYLTGYSMGGNGAWVWASRSPERFAAVAPICPGGHDGYWLFDLDPVAGSPVDKEWHCGSLFSQEAVLRLAGLPVWAFHGYRDSTHPIANSLILTQQLMHAGGNVHFQSLDADHMAWPQVYESEEFYNCLLTCPS